MAIRVALVGTGNCGALALRQLIEDVRFELAAVWVSNEAKIGKDAGELAGLPVVTGVTATGELDDVLAAAPDCVVYCAMGDTRLAEAMAAFTGTVRGRRQLIMVTHADALKSAFDQVVTL